MAIKRARVRRRKCDKRIESRAHSGSATSERDSFRVECAVVDALPPQFRTDASGRLQLAFVISGETDHKMGQAGVGIASEAISNGGGRTSEPCLVLLHHLAAAGIVRLQKLADTRFGPRNVVVDADGQVHRAVERIQVAARLAPHRENVPPLAAEEFRRRPYREPAVEVARGTLHCARRIAPHPDWRGWRTPPRGHPGARTP